MIDKKELKAESRPMGRFNGATVLITGATGGLGSGAASLCH